MLADVIVSDLSFPCVSTAAAAAAFQWKRKYLPLGQREAPEAIFVCVDHHLRSSFVLPCLLHETMTAP